MADLNKAELRRLCEAATPGQWVTDGEEIGGGGKIVAIYVAHEDGGRIGQVFANCLVPTDAKCRANAAFMAAANPTAVLSLLDECESLHSAMGSPDEITAEPAGDYEALRKQFMSLLMLANSKARQAQHWRSQSGHAMHQTLVQTAANVNAERDTNAMLTNALMKAETERDAALAELEACRKDAERWRFVRSPLGTRSPYAVWQEGRMPVFSAIADACIDAAMSQEAKA